MFCRCSSFSLSLKALWYVCLIDRMALPLPQLQLRFVLPFRFFRGPDFPFFNFWLLLSFVPFPWAHLALPASALFLFPVWSPACLVSLPPDPFPPPPTTRFQRGTLSRPISRRCFFSLELLRPFEILNRFPSLPSAVKAFKLRHPKSLPSLYRIFFFSTSPHLCVSHSVIGNPRGVSLSGGTFFSSFPSLL